MLNPTSPVDGQFGEGNSFFIETDILKLQTNVLGVTMSTYMLLKGDNGPW